MALSQRNKKSAFAAAVTAVFLVLLSSSAHRAEAAALSFSTGSGYAIGDSFQVRVLVSTAPGESINAVSANVSYDPNAVSLSSISQDASIISMWATPPSFSNQTGSADLEGVVLNPGFSGQSGLVATLNFKARSAGMTTLSFGQASVLANDGKGTNVLAAAPSKSIYMDGATPGNATTDTGVAAGAPAAPIISSATNPDPTKWYATSSPYFSWEVPPGVTAVRLQYDKSPIATPGILYSPAISSKALSDVADGTYYFHAQFKNSKGWGAIAHFKFNIDTTPPDSFQIREAHPANSTDVRPILLFNTTDSGSGIDHYDVKVGDLDYQTVNAATVASNPYSPPIQDPGMKTVIVIAYDQAGNKTTESADISIEALNPPAIDEYPSSMQSNDMMRIVGHTYPNSKVTIYLKDPNGVETSQDTFTNGNGKFQTIWTNHLGDGLYTFTAAVTDDKGGVSFRSQPYAISIEPQAFMRFGAVIVNYVSLAVLLVVVISALAAALMYAFHRLSLMRSRFRRDLSEAERSVHKRFADLRALEDEMIKHLVVLEGVKSKRELTREEAMMLSSLKKYLSTAEKEITAKLDKLKNETEYKGWTRIRKLD